MLPRIAAAAFLALALDAGAAPEESGEGERASFRIQIEGARSDGGAILCSLFESAEGFPRQRDKARARTQSALRKGSATCEFKDLPPGTYAVAVFHDENGNGQLDLGVLGIPKEGLGYTNVPPKRAPPPPFERAAMKLGSGVTEVNVSLQY